MTSGIYLLTFKNSQQYVGRSINMERRWAEHAEKLRTGKAAKNMQAAYDSYGFPKVKVLMECHSDHCDLMETYYICKIQPELNTVGGIAVSAEELNVLEQHHDWLQLSTVQHLNRMMEYEYTILEDRDKWNKEVHKLNARIKTLENYIDEERVVADVKNELEDAKNVRAEFDLLYKDTEELVLEVHNLKTRNLWERIINKW